MSCTEIFKWHTLLKINGFHPKLKQNRFLFTISVINLAIIFWISSYGSYLYWVNNNKNGSIKQIVGVLLLYTGVVQAYSYKRHKLVFARCIDRINEKLKNIDDFPENIQYFYRSFVKWAKNIENTFFFVISLCSLGFPILYFCRVVKCFVDNSEIRFMIYELAIPFFEDRKHETPIKEIVLVYTSLLIIFCFVYFVGLIGLFVTLFIFNYFELKIVCHKFLNLFENLDEDYVSEVAKRISNTVKFHHSVIR